MQAIIEKQKMPVKHREVNASDRFEARVEIAKHVYNNVANMNDRLCKNLIQSILNDACESRKK